MKKNELILYAIFFCLFICVSTISAQENNPVNVASKYGIKNAQQLFKYNKTLYELIDKCTVSSPSDFNNMDNDLCKKFILSDKYNSWVKDFYNDIKELDFSEMKVPSGRSTSQDRNRISEYNRMVKDLTKFKERAAKYIENVDKYKSNLSLYKKEKDAEKIETAREKAELDRLTSNPNIIIDKYKAVTGGWKFLKWGMSPIEVAALLNNNQMQITSKLTTVEQNRENGNSVTFFYNRKDYFDRRGLIDHYEVKDDSDEKYNLFFYNNKLAAFQNCMNNHHILQYNSEIIASLKKKYPNGKVFKEYGTLKGFELYTKNLSIFTEVSHQHDYINGIWYVDPYAAKEIKNDINKKETKVQNKKETEIKDSL